MGETEQFLSCVDSLSGDTENSLKSMLNNIEDKGDLIVPLGITEEGKVISQDLASIPHMLISGTTGSGKTAFIQSLLGALMLQYGPEKVKFLIFDSKMVDYGIFNSSANLLVPVITNQGKVAGAVEWLNNEVNRRLRLKQEGSSLNDVPEIFLIIDDYSDLSNNESVINELFNLLKTGRLVKIHCIISTSTPTAKIISTELKANIPCRIAFSTASKADSRMILDINGAETLLTPGGMIFKWQNELVKCQCLYVSDDDMQIILNHQNQAMKKIESSIDLLGQMAQELFSGKKNNSYDKSILEEIERNEPVERSKKVCSYENVLDEDPILNDAIDVVLEVGFASTSLLQRRLKIGYARAARIIDEMECRGIVGPYEGANPRKVLITKEQLMGIKSNDITANSVDEKSEIVLKPFPMIESLGSSVQINNNEIIITKPVTVNGRSGRYTYTFPGNMVQQLIYKKAGIFNKGHITFVVVTENIIIRENGGERKIPVTTPSVPITIDFNKNNDPIFYKLISQVSKDINMPVDIG